MDLLNDATADAGIRKLMKEAREVDIKTWQEVIVKAGTIIDTSTPDVTITPSIQGTEWVSATADPLPNVFGTISGCIANLWANREKGKLTQTEIDALKKLKDAATVADMLATVAKAEKEGENKKPAFMRLAGKAANALYVRFAFLISSLRDNGEVTKFAEQLVQFVSENMHNPELYFSDPIQTHLQAGFPLKDSGQFSYQLRRWKNIGLFEKTRPHVVTRTVKKEPPTSLEMALENEFYGANRVFLTREGSDLKFMVYERSGVNLENFPPVVVIAPRDKFLSGHELFQEQEDVLVSVEDLVRQYALCVTNSVAFEKDLEAREKKVSDFSEMFARKKQASSKPGEGAQSPGTSGETSPKTCWQLYGEAKATAAAFKTKAKAEAEAALRR